MIFKGGAVAPPFLQHKNGVVQRSLHHSTRRLFQAGSIQQGEGDLVFRVERIL